MSMTKAQMMRFAPLYKAFQQKLVEGDIEQNIALYEQEIAQVDDDEYRGLLNFHKLNLEKIRHNGYEIFKAHHFEKMQITKRLKAILEALSNANAKSNSADIAVYRSQLERTKKNIRAAQDKVDELQITSLKDIVEALAQISPVSKDFPAEVQQCYKEFLQQKRLSFEAAQKRFDNYSFYSPEKTVADRHSAIQNTIDTIGLSIRIEDDEEFVAFQHLLNQAMRKIDVAFDDARTRFENQGFGKIPNIKERFAKVQNTILAEREKVTKMAALLPEESDELSMHMIFLLQERALLASKMMPPQYDTLKEVKPLMFSSFDTHAFAGANLSFVKPPVC